MKTGFAVLMLLINFIKIAYKSGIDTAMVILTRIDKGQDGVARISYGDLNPGTASLLGAMLTLTPGTTLIDIDTDKRELIMHLLTLDSYEETVAIIQRDFCVHLKVINEVLS
jgi:multisubunit Na+/H+ antiporter MnhE subunit